ncbi:hypothetical protein AAFP30_05550 [Gordonia sp. CPCC 205515]|uniref:hypothetical protein n=1 Tax=Gordonia sp. CPCC 205515 TaxID=3140791 RepID=UPI003AF3EB18
MSEHTGLEPDDQKGHTMPTPNNNRKPNTPAAPQRRRRVRKFDQRSRRWIWTWQ